MHLMRLRRTNVNTRFYDVVDEAGRTWEVWACFFFPPNPNEAEQTGVGCQVKRIELQQFRLKNSRGKVVALREGSCSGNRCEALDRQRRKP